MVGVRMISSKRKATEPTGGAEIGDRFDAIIASSGLAARKAKPRVIGAGAGLVIAGGLIGALMFGSGRDAHQVLVAAHPIDAGTVLTAADMRGVSVSGQIGFRSTSSTEMGALVGKVASVPIPAGSLVVAEQLQLRQSAPPGTVLVDLACTFNIWHACFKRNSCETSSRSNIITTPTSPHGHRTSPAPVWDYRVRAGARSPSLAPLRVDRTTTNTTVILSGHQ